MDPITNLLIQLGVGGGALAVLRWFAGRVLDVMERRIGPRVEQTASAVERMEPQVNDLHQRFFPKRPHLYPTDPDPGDAA